MQIYCQYSQVVEGRQEDAEEFLTCLLNGLSDEMTEQIKLVESEGKDGDEEGEMLGDERENGGEEEEEGWQEVGAKGKSCVTRRVAGSSLPATPIQVLDKCTVSLLNNRYSRGRKDDELLKRS